MGVDIENSLKEFLIEYCKERFIELYQMELDDKKKKLISTQVL